MRIALVLFVSLLLPLAAFADEEEKANEEEKTLYERYEAIAGEAVGRIRYTRRIDWRNVDENSLVAETRRGQFWLLDIERGCIRRTPMQITLDDTQRERRGVRYIERLDTLLIDDTRCAIRQIRPLDSEGVKAIRADD